LTTKRKDYLPKNLEKTIEKEQRLKDTEEILSELVDDFDPEEK
jgi:hypothetical protein